MSLSEIREPYESIYPNLNPEPIEPEKIDTIIEAAGQPDTPPTSTAVEQLNTKTDWNKIQKTIRGILTFISALPLGALAGATLVSVSNASLLLTPIGWGILGASLSLLVINVALSAYTDGKQGAKNELFRAILGVCAGFGVGLFAGAIGVVVAVPPGEEVSVGELFKFLGAFFGADLCLIPSMGILIDYGFRDIYPQPDKTSTVKPQ